MGDQRLPLPYTEYNIFFQIERELVLQMLGVVPVLKAEEVFDTCDKNYEGPELPARYAGILLPSDWYIPGKGLRRRRRHRATHRKISFTDLSKNIASSWYEIDEETKLFCAKLSDIGKKKYKLDMQKHKNSLRTNDTETKIEKKATAIISNKNYENDLLIKEESSYSFDTHSSLTTSQPSSAKVDARWANQTPSTSKKNRLDIRSDFIASHKVLVKDDSELSKQTPSAHISPICGLCATDKEATTCTTLSQKRPRCSVVVDLSDDEILDMYMKSD